MQPELCSGLSRVGWYGTYAVYTHAWVHARMCTYTQHGACTCVCMHCVCVHGHVRAHARTRDMHTGVLDADEVKAAGDLAAWFHLPQSEAAYKYVPNTFSLRLPHSFGPGLKEQWTMVPQRIAHISLALISAFKSGTPNLAKQSSESSVGSVA